MRCLDTAIPFIECREYGKSVSSGWRNKYNAKMEDGPVKADLLDWLRVENNGVEVIVDDDGGGGISTSVHCIVDVQISVL